MSCVRNYAQNGIQESHRDMHFWLYLVDLSSHAALTKKRKICDSRAFVYCGDRLYTPYTFELCLMEKEEEEEEEEEEERRRREEKEQNRNFRV